MKRILKFDLDPGITALKLPSGSEVLSARFQASEYGQGVKLWALGETSKAPKVSTFLVAATGEAVLLPSKYIATVETPSGEMLHVFQIN